MAYQPILNPMPVRGAALTGQSTAFAAAATGNTTGLDVSTAGNVSFILKNTVAASAFGANGVIVFEQSDDNIQWGLLQTTRNDNGAVASTHTIGANAANTEIIYEAALEGVNYLRARLTTGVSTNGVTIVVAPGSLPFSPNVSAILMPTTGGGLSTFHLVSAASTNATNIKASAGQVYAWYIYNSNASARKVAFHNTAGTPTAGVSIFMALVIPALSAANVELGNGIAFSTGISITTVTGLADTDATAVALNDISLNIYYK